MNNALLYLGGLAAAVLAALFAVPYFIDWNSYRGVFEEKASQVMGRDVRVGGAVNLRLLPAPYVSFEKLKIADADGEAGESFFRAESFTMWLSVPPLLKGILEARKVEINRPVVKLVAGDTGGNWQSFTLNPGQVPFVPKDVALQSVTLVDGAISLGSAGQGELVRIDDIDGELAAETLFGPYKFAGTLAWQGKPREVRLATGAKDAKGDISFKSTVRSLDTGNSYLLAGRVGGIDSKPEIEGDLTAQVRLSLAPATEAAPVPETPLLEEKAVVPGEEKPAAAAGAEPPAPGDEIRTPLLPASSAKPGAPPFEMRGKLKGGTAGLELSDITLSLDEAGAPQLITGSAKLSWQEKTRLEVALQSRWLDLDKLAGSEGAAVPMNAARGFAEALVANLPDEADTRTTLEVDQVTLGGENLSGVRLEALRAGGPLEIKNARAGLPGGTRLELAGIVSGAPGARAFDGRVSIDGQSFSRFVAWSAKQPNLLPGRAEGRFSADGHLKLSGDMVDVSDALVELAGMPLAGGLKLSLGKRRKVQLAVDGQRIDLGNLWPGALDLKQLAAATGGSAEGATEPGTAMTSVLQWLSGADSDVSVRMRAAEVLDGERRLSDVDADVAIENGMLSMPVLKFTANDGLSIDIQGAARDLKSSAKGVVSGTITAATPAAVAALAEFSGLSNTAGTGAARHAAMAPLRLAGKVEAGQRRPGAVDVVFDGQAGGGRLNGWAYLDGGWSGWRKGASDVAITLSGMSVDRLAGVVAGAGLDKAAPIGPALGRFVIHAGGQATNGLLTVASLDAAGQAVDFEGRMTFGDTGTTGLAGDATIRSGDAASLLALSGLHIGRGADAAVAGSAHVSSMGEVTEIQPRELIIGGAKVSGSIKIARGGDIPTVTAELDVDKATIPGLLTALVDRTAPAPAALPLEPAKGADAKARRAAAAAVAAAPVSIPSVWPEAGFDTAFFDRFTGTAAVRFGTLALDQGLNIADATLDAALTPGRLEVKSLEGHALGGRVRSRLAFDKAAAGVTLAGNVAIETVAGPMDGSPAAPAGDASSFRLDMSGRALGPSALVSSLTGKGEIVLGSITLNGNTPKAVAQVAEAALQGKGPNSGEPLAEALKVALKDGKLALGKLTVPVTLADGNLRLQQIQIETEDGRSTFDTVVELQTLRADSEWQIEPKVARVVPAAPAAAPAPDAAAGAAAAPAQPAETVERVLLPPLTVAYTGRLSEMTDLEPIVSMGALERELSVRKMERDVDELERLRKMDQVRAKADLERQKALEAERLKALEAQPPAPGTSGALDGAAPDGTAPDALGPDGLPLQPGEPAAPGSTAAVDAAPAAGSVPPEETKPVSRPKKRPPSDSWKPFQIQQF